ncbi:MAG: hypothetical protein RL701_1977 [Pseudomonadota bacterium]
MNTWSMYVHELSGLGADCYVLDAAGHWHPNVSGDWVANITPNINLRVPQSALDPRQPFQRTHVITLDRRPIGFACVASQPFRYMPQDVDRQLAEFFIIHGYRGVGVSQCAFEALLATYPPGRWHLRILPGNTRARRFWPKALAIAGVTERDEREEDDNVTWRFVSSR